MTEPQTITATQLKNQSGAILRQVSQEKKHLIVERDGFPLVAIIPLEEYQRLLRGQSASEQVIYPAP